MAKRGDGRSHPKRRKGYGPSKLTKCLLLVPLKYGSRREATRALKHHPKLREAIGLNTVPDRTAYSHFEKRIGPWGFTLVFLVLAWQLAKAGVVLGERRRNRANLLRRWHTGPRWSATTATGRRTSASTP